MVYDKHSMGWGLFLIFLGIVFLIGNISDVSMEILWPVFPFAVGLAFIIGYFYNRKSVGLLMPGSILTLISLLFFYCNFFGWWHMEDLWPVFILAPATGFVSMYLGGSRDSGLLVPAGILGALAFIFLFISTGIGDYWSVFLIIAGLILIGRHFIRSEKVQSSDK